MFKRLFFSLGILLLMMLLPATIYAQGGSISGTINDSSGCVTPGGVAPGDIIQFTVSESGSYTFSYGPHTWANSAWSYLHEGSFDPTQGSFLQSSFINRVNSTGSAPTFSTTLTAGTTYYLATNNNQGLGTIALCNARGSTDSGTYTVNVTGPGVLCFVTCSTASPITVDNNPCPVFYDGRINHCDTFTSVVLYGKADEDDNWDLDVYAADDSGLLVTIPASMIAAVPTCPESNTLIFSDSATGISLHRLTQRPDGSCPFQLNAPATEAGKTYIVIFNELYPHSYYESYEEVLGQ